jgi:predicted aspartyl protease
MITGKVTNSLEATISLTVVGPGGQQQEIGALIDTGFDGWLSLPSPLFPFSSSPGADEAAHFLPTGARRFSIFMMRQ